VVPHSNTPKFIPQYSNRQVAYATLFVVSILLLFFLLYRFSQIVFILLVAIVLGTAVRPVVNWLNRRGIPRPVGVLFVYLLLLCLVAGLIVLLPPLFAGQFKDFTSNLPVYYGIFRSSLLQSSSHILQQIAIQLPQQITGFTSNPGTGTEEMLSRLAQSLTYIDDFSHGLFIALAVFILGFYWVLESDRFIHNALLWAPLNQRDSIRELIAEIEAKLGGFILGQGFLCLIVGVMALIAYLVIGLPYALLLAVFAGIMEAVPIFGPILGAVPALLIALSIGPATALWVVAATLVIQALENHLLVPRVMRRSVGVNSLVTLLAFLAFTSLLGLMGAILAVPMAAIIQLIINRFVLTPAQTQVQTVDGRDRLSRLRYEAQELTLDVRKQLRENEQLDGAEQEVVDELEEIAIDLDRLLSQSETVEEKI